MKRKTIAECVADSRSLSFYLALWEREYRAAGRAFAWYGRRLRALRAELARRAGSRPVSS